MVLLICYFKISHENQFCNLTHQFQQLFSPLEATSKRGRTRRGYEPLSICMASRAIHIEVAQSLKMDSFMLLQGLLEIAGSGPMKTLPVTKELAKLVLQGHKTSLITPRDG